ncbi:MAG: hypothetical protein Terrestrivirus15_5 [Terrestrivirus sp.]|uniref:Uncharacterized protein n=1 Tax=Terrestrivirus sp. TaxID=2487775 RepID=A0A3G4ZPD4_9VIRU|nr:MAG: hypothetical protein Terrestrivirus15_5 [Terrestrivirus sp.]
MSENFYTEFFIASSSCKNDSIRCHRNICVNNLKDAFEFAKNTNCQVFQGWEMWIWHYKIINGEQVLENKYNLNDYITGMKNEKGKFIPISVIKRAKQEKEDHQFVDEDYNEVIYNFPENLLDVSNKQSDVLEVFCYAPTSLKQFKFKLNHGYMLEDSDKLYDYINNKYVENNNKSKR